MSIADEEDAQNFEFPRQGAPKHRKIDMTNHEMCGEVWAQADSLQSLNSNSVATEQGSSKGFIEAV